MPICTVSPKFFDTKCSNPPNCFTPICCISPNCCGRNQPVVLCVFTPELHETGITATRSQASSVLVLNSVDLFSGLRAKVNRSKSVNYRFFILLHPFSSPSHLTLLGGGQSALYSILRNRKVTRSQRDKKSQKRSFHLGVTVVRPVAGA